MARKLYPIGFTPINAKHYADACLFVNMVDSLNVSKMKKSLEETLKEVELCKKIYSLHALEHLTISEISEKIGVARSNVYRKIRTFEAENPELAEKMSKNGKEIIPEDYKKMLQEMAELKKQLKAERLRADFYEEMVAFGKEVYGIDLKKAGTK